jgi:hypothetical protein
MPTFLLQITTSKATFIKPQRILFRQLIQAIMNT